VPLIQETGRFKPVHLGHYEIHQREMRRVEMKGRQRMVPTEGFPNYDPFGMLLQSRFESAPCGRTVIDYKDTDQANSFRCRRLSEVDAHHHWNGPGLWTQYPGHPRITRNRLYDAGPSPKVCGIRTQNPSLVERRQTDMVGQRGYGTTPDAHSGPNNFAGKPRNCVRPLNV
jgi:hypothetical protein